MDGSPDPLGGDALLTVQEVADAMRVSAMTVYRLIQAGEMPAIRVGKNYRIKQSQFRGYLNSGQTAPVPGGGANGGN